MIETRDDFLKLINREADFERIQGAVQKLRSELPQLEDWLRRNPARLAEVADDVTSLIAVTCWFRQNPNPRRFAREIPIAVDTKFIERHQKTLREWFDTAGVLPPHGVRSDEEDFFRRYGLLDREPFVLLHALEQRVQEDLSLPCSQCMLPLDDLSRLPVTGLNVIVVENKTNVRAFPKFPSGLAVFGGGYAAALLRSARWLNENRVFYWGDMDSGGFAILSQFRQFVPHVRSMLMTADLLDLYGQKCPSLPSREQKAYPLLTASERVALEMCVTRQVRVEQERIPQEVVTETVRQLLSAV